MSTPRVGVVIVGYHAAERAARLAQAVVAEQGVAAGDVVVVDNGSDGTDRAAAGKLFDGTWIDLPNPGYGAAVNAGERALPDGVTHLAMLADDVTLGPGVLAGLAAEFADASVGLAGPELLDSRDGSVWSHGGTITGRVRNPHHLRPDRDHPGPPLWLDDAVTMVRREDFRLLNGFDERYFLYYEDVDLGRRVTRDLGKRVVARTDLTASKDPGEHLSSALDTRNRLRLQRKHGEWVALALLLAETLARTAVGAAKRPGAALGLLREKGRAVREGLLTP